MTLKKLFISHPSRGRPEMGINCALALIRNRTSGLPISYVFSFDFDDPSLPEYKNRISSSNLECRQVIRNNAGAVSALNEGAKLATDEDVVMSMNDDIASSVGWDERLVRAVSEIRNPDFLLHPFDMDNGKDIPIIQILSASLYRRLGYMLPPCYLSMYADTDLLATCRNLGVVVPCPGLGFDHRHPNWGKGNWDATYERENSGERYRYGQEMFERRKKQGFVPVIQ